MSTDSRGCLTAEGLVILREAPPGAVPEALARHLAGCAACQRRVLEVEAGPRASRRAPTRDVLPSLGRTALLLLVVLVAIVFFIWTVRQMVGR